MRLIFQVNFILWSLGTFSLPVKQQRIWKCQAAETPTCLSFIKVKMQSSKEIEVVTNLIATPLYHGRTDLIPILTFSKTACCIQLHSWSSNMKCKQLMDKHLTSYYLYFQNLKIHEMLNFVRVGSGVTKEVHAIFWTFGSFGQRWKYDTNKWTSNHVTIEI